jgi:hypothetical protein
MLNNAEKIMTPKLRLKEHARKPLLSCMRNRFWLGNRRTMYSM